MIGVRATNEKAAAELTNSKKVFEDKRTSVATTNNVVLTPAHTALFIASVETTRKTKITYSKLKGTGDFERTFLAAVFVIFGLSFDMAKELE